jgi:hypothetical protein
MMEMIQPIFWVATATKFNPNWKSVWIMTQSPIQGSGLHYSGLSSASGRC